MNRFPMTVEGAETLQRELERRKSVDRKRIVQSISVAREHGDLKENAEYHAAREEQSHNEGRIQLLEEKLSLVQVIDVTTIDNGGRVIFGATVHLVNLDTNEEMIYKIVGEEEADIKGGKISVTSPISRAIVGKMVGSEVDVMAPSGNITYSIAQVDYI